ncbi:MAG: SdrD B-like domain-containing protein [Acidimicrobiia bacterium]|nr:SdrD B-like domain-containing protein [Acidimicrobiia bacterium]
MRNGLSRSSGGIAVLAFLLVALTFVLVGPLEAGATSDGGEHRPPAGCVKLEDPNDIPSTTEVALANGVTVTFDWTTKPSEAGEWIGFEWSAVGGSAYGTVKASTEVYDWGPSQTGTFLVPDDENGRVHAISYVIVCGEPLPHGSITVIKDAVPDAADTPFGFVLDGLDDPVEFELIDDGESPGLAARTFDELSPGTYAVGETALPEGWDLTDIDCGEADVSVDGDAVFIELEDGDQVVCVFTNEREEEIDLGSITVIKTTSPETAQEFLFTLEPGDYQPVAGNGGTYTWAGLEAGTYNLFETLTEAQSADGWHLETVECDNEDDPDAITLEAGGDVVCTFDNHQTVDFVLEKLTNVESQDEFSFELDGVALVDLAGGETFETVLEEGTYTVTELIVDGWDLFSIVCTGAESTVDIAAASVELLLLPGADVRCTFVNNEEAAELGVIGDYVWHDADEEGDQDGDEQPLAGIQVDLLDSNGRAIASTKTDVLGLYSFFNVPEGDYRVRFHGPTGWTFTKRDAAADAIDSDALVADKKADPQIGETDLFHLNAGAVDLSRDAGLFGETRVLPQVITTTTTAATATTTTIASASTTAETLPFTGAPEAPSLIGLATALLALGLMAVLAIKRREDLPVTGWSQRLRDTY